MEFEKGKPLAYDKLLIATGAKSNKFGWPGQDLKGVQGMYSYQDLLALEENTKYGISRAVKSKGLILSKIRFSNRI